jgi:nucleoside-diphosphate-sugar epimerase
MGEKLVVTGASGFLGSAICRLALGKGYEVAGLDLISPSMELNEFIKGDIRNTHDVVRALKGAYAVIHTAAITVNLIFEQNPREGISTNVEGFHNVMQVAKDLGVSRFLYASSSYVYTDNLGDLNTSYAEDAVLDVHKQRNMYAKSKMQNEMIADFYNDLYTLTNGKSGFPTLGIRYFNMYGLGEHTKGEYTSVLSKFIGNRKRGERIEVFKQLNLPPGKLAGASKDMIHVNDAAAITLKLMETKERGIVNCGTGEATAYSDIAEMVHPGQWAWVDNPLTTYQAWTRASTVKLKGIIGEYEFTPVRKGVEEQLRHHDML